MGNDAMFRLLMGVVIAGLFMVRVGRHAEVLHSGPATRFESKLNMAARGVAGLAGFAMLILYLAKPEWMSWASIPLPRGGRFAGAGAGAAADAMLAWVHHELGQNFSPTLHLHDQHTLVTSGPYRWIRHPMYTAFYMLGLSFFLLSANWFIGGAFLGGLTAVMISRVAKEDALMAGRFGQQYQTWAGRTGRFLPRLRG